MKNSNFKKILVSAALIVCLAATGSYKSAEASCFIAADGIFGSVMNDDLGHSLEGYGGLAGIGAGIWLLHAVPNGWGITGGVLLILLDADGSVAQSALEQAFNTAYPFVDNPDVVANLARLVKSKVGRPVQKGEKFMVSLTEEETRTALNAADMTPEQIGQIVNDLR